MLPRPARSPERMKTSCHQKGRNMLTSSGNLSINRRKLLRSGAFTGVAAALSPALGLGQDSSPECPRRCNLHSTPKTPAALAENEPMRKDSPTDKSLVITHDRDLPAEQKRLCTFNRVYGE